MKPFSSTVTLTMLLFITTTASTSNRRVQSADVSAPGTRSLGHTLFVRPFTSKGGLGPRFNATSCVACHDSPAAGGAGTRLDAYVEWTYSSLADVLGEPAQRFSLTPDGAIIGLASRTPARRKPPALFGLGQLEAIPVDALRARADPFDADGDGISGRLPWRDDCFGRFGWQSSVCDVSTFVTGALSRELGVESFPRSRREIPERDRQALVAYVRSLPPPIAAGSANGADVFERALCARCHVPVAGTASIEGVPTRVTAYTDLLVHEMGGGQRHADRDSRTEFRTPPLWGVASTGPPYLHDGSATSLEQAILRHRGEGERSRRLFAALSGTEKQQLLGFLRTR